MSKRSLLGMNLAFLAVVFLVIVVLLAFKRPLWQAIIGGLIACALLFSIPVPAALACTLAVFRKQSSVNILLSLYMITYLQRMLEARGQIRLAQHDLDGLFHNRRVNAVGAPLFIGLLPSAAAMLLCGDIVKDATEGYLTREEQAYITSWLRHIPESSLPTYNSVLLMSTLSGVSLQGIMLGMLIPLVMLTSIGYYPYVHRLPKDPGTPVSKNRLKDAVNLFSHTWTLLLIIFLILAFKVSIVVAVALSIAAGLVFYRFKPSDALGMITRAFETKMLLNTFLVLVLKEFLGYTGVMETLPETFAALPIPTYLVFVLLFFVSTVISGNAATIAMGVPLVFAAIPDAGIPMVVLLLGICHAAMQVSPTHVCLVVASEYFGVSMGRLIKKTIPAALLFSVLMVVYYNIVILL